MRQKGNKAVTVTVTLGGSLMTAGNVPVDILKRIVESTIQQNPVVFKRLADL